MKLLKIVVACFLALFLLFLVFRLITAPGTDAGFFVIIVACCMGCVIPDGERRGRWRRRNL